MKAFSFTRSSWLQVGLPAPTLQCKPSSPWLHAPFGALSHCISPQCKGTYAAGQLVSPLCSSLRDSVDEVEQTPTPKQCHGLSHLHAPLSCCRWAASGCPVMLWESRLSFHTGKLCPVFPYLSFAPFLFDFPNNLKRPLSLLFPLPNFFILLFFFLRSPYPIFNPSLLESTSLAKKFLDQRQETETFPILWFPQAGARSIHLLECFSFPLSISPLHSAFSQQLHPIRLGSTPLTLQLFLGHFP